MPSTFENNWRRKQEIKLRPFANKVYQQVFGKDIFIERFEKEDEWVLDKYFAMDVKITLPDGLILTGQEKFLSNKYATNKTLTVEFLQNPQTGEKGDWYKLGVQFYFTGYENNKNDGFYPWILVNWPSIVLATHEGKLSWHFNNNQNDGARASFAYCYMNQIPEECIIAKYINYSISYNKGNS